MRVNRGLAVVLIVLASQVFACATKVSTSYVAPARLPIENLKSIAVVVDYGPYSLYADAATELQVYAARYIEESGFYRVIQGSKLFSSGEISLPSKDSPMISWARGQGADGICFLSIERARVREDLTYERRQEDVHTGEYRERVYIEDNQVKKRREEIIRHETKMIPTMRKNGELHASLTLIDVRTAEVRTTRSYERTLNKTAHGESNVDYMDSNVRMIESMARSIAKDVARDLVPQQVKEKVVLAEDSSCSDGNKLARQGKWDEARQKWLDVLNGDSANQAALYNLGVADEVAQRYDDALKYYERASAIERKELYENAARRMRVRIGDREKLNEQMKGRTEGQSEE